MKNWQSGQTMIEAIVALMTMMVILTAIAVVIVNGLYNSQFIKNQNEANKYAQQGMEYVRDIQQNDLGVFSALVAQNSSFFCVDEANNTLSADKCSATGVNTGSSYNRTISFSNDPSICLTNSEIRVTVTVTWSSSKCGTNTFCHKSQLVSCMPFNLPSSNP